MALERETGFDVVATAENGRAGVDAAERTRPDLVLLDLTMPVMDGLEAAPLIRTACPDATVIMVSAFSGTRMRGPALAAGAHCYVEKGGSLRSLMTSIHDCLERFAS